MQICIYVAMYCLILQMILPLGSNYVIEFEVATSNSISNFNINVACSGQCTMYVAIYWRQMVVRICSYCSYLMFFISYNATIAANTVVAQLFLYRTWTALHHAVGDEVESKL